jgi:NADPH:quinone reductase-like Zn-dependent oxidoreductase
LVLGLGADDFIDLGQDSLDELEGEVDLVFDLIGGEVLGRAWSILRPGGGLVSAVEDPSSRPEAREGIRSVFFVVEASGAMLDELADQLGAGRLRPTVGDVRPLPEGRGAFVEKRAGGVRGKTVLTVGTGDGK